jgi:hypothetical protein
MGSMARSEREGNSRGTIATASCEKITRPHDASADHSTSHGDDDDLRSRWSPVASLLIAAGNYLLPLLLRRRRLPGPRTIKAGGRRERRSSRAPAGGRRRSRRGPRDGSGSGGRNREEVRGESLDAVGRWGEERAAAFRRTCAVRGSKQQTVEGGMVSSLNSVTR